MGCTASTGTQGAAGSVVVLLALGAVGFIVRRKRG
jgi:MYXO-CTERM domain-containing protein